MFPVGGVQLYFSFVAGFVKECVLSGY